MQFPMLHLWKRCCAPALIVSTRAVSIGVNRYDLHLFSAVGQQIEAHAFRTAKLDLKIKGWCGQPRHHWGVSCCLSLRGSARGTSNFLA